MSIQILSDDFLNIGMHYSENYMTTADQSKLLQENQQLRQRNVKLEGDVPLIVKTADGLQGKYDTVVLS